VPVGFLVAISLYCAHCGRPMLVTLSEGPLGDERDEVDPRTQPQRWACPWCQRHNDGVFPGWLLEATSLHG